QLQQAALLSRDGVVLVNLPHPVRYALHKLLVYGERDAAFRAKAHKDLQQAGMLLGFYKERAADEVAAIWEDDLLQRGKGWTSRVAIGWRALNAAYPELDLEDWLRLPQATRRKGQESPGIGKGKRAVGRK